MLLSNTTIKIKSIIFCCCTLLGQITYAETNIYFPRNVNTSIQSLPDINAKPLVTPNRIYKFFEQLYHQQTYGAFQPKTYLTGLFWPDVFAWNTQVLWIDLGICLRAYPGLNSQQSLYTESFSSQELLDLFVKLPFGIGYRKFFSSTRLIGGYLYSETLRKPSSHLHAGIEIGLLPLLQFTLHGHYNFAFNEQAFFNQHYLGRAEEKFGVSLYLSSNALHQSNFTLLHSLTPYAGISYNPYACNLNIQDDSIPKWVERWDAIIGIDFTILEFMHLSIHSNIIQGITSNFQKSLCLQFYWGPDTLGSKKPERYVVNKASEYIHKLSIRMAKHFEAAAAQQRAAEMHARLSATLQRFAQGGRVFAV